MRGIKKPWPPGDVYPDGHGAASMQKAEAAYLKALPNANDQSAFARSAFDGLDKSKLRTEMYREQRSLCIFCERRIGEGDPKRPRIDHWYPLSREPGLALHWKNLHLSCAKLETCDSAKDDHPFRWDDESHVPWPVNFRYEDVVGFTSRAEIYVRSDVMPPDPVLRAIVHAIAGRTGGNRVQRGIVNLNDPALVKARSAAVRGERKLLEKDFENRTATRDEREQRASQLLARSQLPEFVSIRVAWLRKTLGRGRP